MRTECICAGQHDVRVYIRCLVFAEQYKCPAAICAAGHLQKGVCYWLYFIFLPYSVQRTRPAANDSFPVEGWVF